VELAAIFVFPAKLAKMEYVRINVLMLEKSAVLLQME
jgi:hypothetical protein